MKRSGANGVLAGNVEDHVTMTGSILTIRKAYSLRRT